jgi:hypothetical protein
MIQYKVRWLISSNMLDIKAFFHGTYAAVVFPQQILILFAAAAQLQLVRRAQDVVGQPSVT